MADEKKTDEKPKRKGGDALYDNSDMDGSKAKAKPADGEGDGGGEKGAGGTDGTTGGDKVTGPRDVFMEGLKAIRKRHEKERGDYHNGIREHLRTMATRHDKEFADHYDLHFKEGDAVEDAKSPPDKSVDKPTEKAEG